MCVPGSLLSILWHFSHFKEKIRGKNIKALAEFAKGHKDIVAMFLNLKIFCLFFKNKKIKNIWHNKFNTLQKLKTVLFNTKIPLMCTIMTTFRSQGQTCIFKIPLLTAKGYRLPPNHLNKRATRTQVGEDSKLFTLRHKHPKIRQKTQGSTLLSSSIRRIR